jgi:hypothetical protein
MERPTPKDVERQVPGDELLVSKFLTRRVYNIIKTIRRD